MPLNGNAVFAKPNHSNVWEEAVSGSLSCKRGPRYSASLGGSTQPKDAASSPNVAVSQAAPHDLLVHVETCVLRLFTGFGSFLVAENLLPKVSLFISVC